MSDIKKLEFDEIKKFVRLVEKSEISELEITQEGVTLRIKKELSGNHPSPAPLSAQVIAPPIPAQPPAAPKAAAPAPEVPITPDKNLLEVKSPMVGTFYGAPSPEADPYVSIGDTVSPGSVLCIVEAMKLMNEIECEVTGSVVEICVENGKPVEFGQTLFRIEPAEQA